MEASHLKNQVEHDILEHQIQEKIRLAKLALDLKINTVDPLAKLVDNKIKIA